MEILKNLESNSNGIMTTFKKRGASNEMFTLQVNYLFKYFLRFKEHTAPKNSYRAKIY